MKRTLTKTFCILFFLILSSILTKVCAQDQLKSDLSRNALENALSHGHIINSVKGIDLSLGGFIEADIMYDLKCQNNSSFFRSSEIKVPNSGGGKTQFNVADTRLRLVASNQKQEEDILRGIIEFDFRNPGNSPRLRHAYIEYRGLGFGLYWSNFVDNQIFPNLVINTGGPNALLLVRHPQVRFSKKIFDTEVTVSLEENKFDVANIPGHLRGRENLPDFTASIKQKITEASYLRLGLLANPISYTNTETLNQVDHIFGLAANLTGNFSVSSTNRLKFQGAVGSGFSHYVEDLNTLGLEAIADGEQLKPLTLVACWLFLEHDWNSRWDSTIGWGYNHIDKDGTTSNSALKETHFGAVNISYKPGTSIKTAVEFIYGSRTNYVETSDPPSKGQNMRLQLTSFFRF